MVQEKSRIRVAADESFEKFVLFAIAFAEDLAMGMLVIAGLGLCKWAFGLLYSVGVDKDHVKPLEDVHFWGSYATYSVLTLDFVFRLVGRLIKGS